MLRLTAVLFCVLGPVSAGAACTRPGPAPVVPSGSSADEATMVAAHDSVQSYVNALEAYQACLIAQADGANNDVPVELKLTWRLQADAALDAANVAANAFSVALKAFKERTAPPKP